MRKLISILTITTALASPVFAAGDDQHDHTKNSQGAQGMQMGMMDHKQMAAMHDHMKEMKATMSRIKAETDPVARKKLMKQHRESMMDGMEMMGGDLGMDKKQHASMRDMGMTKRMDMMEQRMGMMQEMMGQMMEHEALDKHK